MSMKINKMHADRDISEADIALRLKDRSNQVHTVMIDDETEAKAFAKTWLRQEDITAVYTGEAHDAQIAVDSISNGMLTEGVKQYADTVHKTAASERTAFKVLTSGLVVAFAGPAVLKELAADLMAQQSPEDLNKIQRKSKYKSRAQVASHLVTQFADAFAKQSELASGLLKKRAQALASYTMAQDYERLLIKAREEVHNPFMISGANYKYCLKAPDLNSLQAANVPDTFEFEAADGEYAEYTDKGASDEEEIQADSDSD